MEWFGRVSDRPGRRRGRILSMIAIQVVSQSLIDRGAFMPAAKQVTGLNHVTCVDKNPGLSRLADDLSIIKDFSDLDTDLSTAITYVGFLACGFDEDIDQFIAFARGMPHTPTSRIDRRGVRAVLIAGSLDQWRIATVGGCGDTTVRQAYNDVYRQLTQLGLGWLFAGFRTVNTNDGQFLLEKK
jgi:hypothetical protein